MRSAIRVQKDFRFIPYFVALGFTTGLEVLAVRGISLYEFCPLS
jgi:hypothetical protein